MTGSWKDKGNQYTQLVKGSVLYAADQWQATFPQEVRLGFEINLE